MDWVRLCDEFLVALAQMGRSESTIKQYGWHLERFVAWCVAADCGRVEDVSRFVLRSWGAGLREGWSPATVRQAVCAVRGVVGFGCDEYELGCDLRSALVLPRVPRRVQRTLSVEEVGQLLAACAGERVIDVRNCALVSLMVDSGLRAAEVCRLECKAVEVGAGVLVVRVKGGRTAQGWFGELTAGRLARWLEVREAAAGVTEVFVAIGGTRPGYALTGAGLLGILRRLGDRAGVAGVCPHALRRSFACCLVEAGAPTRVVQLAGRWSNVSMVERYTAGLSTGRVVQQWSAAEWVENGGGADR